MIYLLALGFRAITVLRKFVFLLTIALVSGQIEAATVDSVSSEILDYSGEDAFWQATVRCEGSSRSVVIQQRLKQEQWCPKDQSLPCLPSKWKMAEEVCLNLKAETPAASRPAQANVQNRARSVPRSTSPAPTETKDNTKIEAQQRAVQQRKQEQLAALAADQRQLERELSILKDEKRSLVEAEQEINAEERTILEQLRLLDE